MESFPISPSPGRGWRSPSIPGSDRELTFSINSRSGLTSSGDATSAVIALGEADCCAPGSVAMAGIYPFDCSAITDPRKRLIEILQHEDTLGVSAENSVIFQGLGKVRSTVQEFPARLPDLTPSCEFEFNSAPWQERRPIPLRKFQDRTTLPIP